MSVQDKLDIVKQANREMLDYFNRAFLNQLEDIQSIKTQIFEIDIKMDELKKTKELYTFKTNSRKSVFSPFISDGSDTERGKIINEQMQDLTGVRESLIMKIRSMEIRLSELKNRLSTLNEASDAISSLSSTDLAEAGEHEEDEGFTFIDEEPDTTDVVRHGYNILMQDAFDKAVTSTLLDKHVKDSVTALGNKLDMIQYLLGTDVNRARVTLKELRSTEAQILDSIDDVEKRLDYGIDSSGALSEQITEFLADQRAAYPDTDIRDRVDFSEPGRKLHPIYTINTMKLLRIFFDNIYQHAEASEIQFTFSQTTNAIEVNIVDNGVGISPDYMTESPWYSSLHKAEEIIFLLGGHLTITGDLMTGTTVRFGFSIND